MSELEELVARDGVLMAGRFGPDGRVAEHKADPWYLGNPVAAQMATWFCSAITTTLSSMAYAIDVASGASAGSGIASLDELDRLAGNRQP